MGVTMINDAPCLADRTFIIPEEVAGAHRHLLSGLGESSNEREKVSGECNQTRIAIAVKRILPNENRQKSAIPNVFAWLCFSLVLLNATVQLTGLIPGRFGLSR
jgi:hypothetical protein